MNKLQKRSYTINILKDLKIIFQIKNIIIHIFTVGKKKNL